MPCAKPLDTWVGSENADMSYLFIRHGETALNAARIFQPADTPLSALGQAQAHAVAARLAAHPAAAIVSSDLPRAAQTAAAIGLACGLEVDCTPLLQERNFGDLRGLPYDTLGHNAIDMAGAPPNGESMADVEARAQRAWAFLQARRANLAGPLVVVSHGAFLRALMLVLRVPGVHASLRLDNTAVSELALAPPHGVMQLNCTRHLGAHLKDSGHSLVGG
jgi:broad specificity phosphatase PhoE